MDFKYVSSGIDLVTAATTAKSLLLKRISFQRGVDYKTFSDVFNMIPSSGIRWGKPANWTIRHVSRLLSNKPLREDNSKDLYTESSLGNVYLGMRDNAAYAISGYYKGVDTNYITVEVFPKELFMVGFTRDIISGNFSLMEEIHNKSIMVMIGDDGTILPFYSNVFPRCGYPIIDSGDMSYTFDGIMREISDQACEPIEPEDFTIDDNALAGVLHTILPHDLFCKYMNDEHFQYALTDVKTNWKNTLVENLDSFIGDDVIDAFKVFGEVNFNDATILFDIPLSTLYTIFGVAHYSIIDTPSLFEPFKRYMLSNEDFPSLMIRSIIKHPLFNGDAVELVTNGNNTSFKFTTTGRQIIEDLTRTTGIDMPSVGSYELQCLTGSFYLRQTFMKEVVKDMWYDKDYIRGFIMKGIHFD